MRDVFFWVAVLSCAAGQAMILRSTIRARAHGVNAPPPAGVARPRFAAELGWTLLPALGLAVTLAFTWRAMRSDSAMMMDMRPSHQMTAPAAPR